MLKVDTYLEIWEFMKFVAEVQSAILHGLCGPLALPVLLICPDADGNPLLYEPTSFREDDEE